MGEVTKVGCFKTSDGKLCEDQQIPKSHQCALDFHEWGSHNIRTGGEWSAYMVTQEILANWQIGPRSET